VAEPTQRNVSKFSGDLSIFCLYKTFGLADGAAVISNSPVEPMSPRWGVGIARVATRHVLCLLQRWGWLAELSRRLRGADEDDPEGDFALDAYRHGPHASMSFLLPRVADPAVQDTRAKNFAFHLKVLKHFVPEPFTHVPEVVSPLPFQSSQIESRN
jgi:hypothetical protein